MRRRPGKTSSAPLEEGLSDSSFFTCDVSRAEEEASAVTGDCIRTLREQDEEEESIDLVNTKELKSEAGVDDDGSDLEEFLSFSVDGSEVEAEKPRSGRNKREQFEHSKPVSYDRPDPPMSERDSKIAQQLSAWGHSAVMFSFIGFCLFAVSKLLGISFDRWLGMVLLGGLGMLAARPNYNPKYSRTINHGLGNAEIETIRMFARKRLTLQQASGDNRKQVFNELRKSLSANNVRFSENSKKEVDPADKAYHMRRKQQYYPTPQPLETMLQTEGSERP